MGCDIHMFIEYRIDGGEWQADKNHVMTDEDYIEDVPAAHRNYELFSAIAGVRSGWGEQERQPLGLPGDLSDVVKQASDRWGVDGHSHSWISLDDFKKLIKYRNGRYRFGIQKTDRDDAFYDWAELHFDKWPPAYSTIVNYCDKIKDNIDWITVERHLLQDKTKHTVDVRLVFWFDN